MLSFFDILKLFASCCCKSCIKIDLFSKQNWNCGFEENHGGSREKVNFKFNFFQSKLNKSNNLSVTQSTQSCLTTCWHSFFFFCFFCSFLSGNVLYFDIVSNFKKHSTFIVAFKFFKLSLWQKTLFCYRIKNHKNNILITIII